MNIKTAADKVWGFIKDHKTAIITGMAIGASVGIACDTDNGKKVLEAGARGLNVVIKAGEEAEKISAPAPSSSKKPEHLEFYDLVNLREERAHEERMAEIKGKYRMQELEKEERPVNAEGTVE